MWPRNYSRVWEVESDLCILTQALKLGKRKVCAGQLCRGGVLHTGRADTVMFLRLVNVRFEQPQRYLGIVRGAEQNLRPRPRPTEGWTQNPFNKIPKGATWTWRPEKHFRGSIRDSPGGMLRDDAHKSSRVWSGVGPLQLKHRVKEEQATPFGEAGLGLVMKGLVGRPQESGFHHEGSEKLIKAN